jgi:mycothiol synthase
MQPTVSHQIQSYPYHPADRTLLLDLVRSRPPQHRADYPALADLGELLDLAQTAAFTRLWKDETGSLAGYALLDCGETYAGLTIETAACVPLSALGPQMLDWADQTFRSGYRGQASGIGLTVRAAHGELIALLEGHGYVRQPDEVLHLSRSLREPIPAPALPTGYRIRPLAGEAEAPAWVDLHRAAFGTANMTLEHKLAMMRQPGYDPALDLVAQAPDGSLAAYVVCSCPPDGAGPDGLAIGSTDPLGTHPLHQGKGLSRALLLSGLALLQQRGMHEARLGTGSENLAMQRAAVAAGYHIAERLFFYEKELKTGQIP